MGQLVFFKFNFHKKKKKFATREKPQYFYVNVFWRWTDVLSLFQTLKTNVLRCLVKPGFMDSNLIYEYLALRDVLFQYL